MLAISGIGVGGIFLGGNIGILGCGAMSKKSLASETGRCCAKPSGGWPGRDPQGGGLLCPPWQRARTGPWGASSAALASWFDSGWIVDTLGLMPKVKALLAGPCSAARREEETPDVLAACALEQGDDSAQPGGVVEEAEVLTTTGLTRAAPHHGDTAGAGNGRYGEGAQGERATGQCRSHAEAREVFEGLDVVSAVHSPPAKRSASPRGRPPSCSRIPARSSKRS